MASIYIEKTTLITIDMGNGENSVRIILNDGNGKIYEISGMQLQIFLEYSAKHKNIGSALDAILKSVIKE